MKIGLIDIDSKMPNLALMKLSTYHKARGDTVEWWKGALFNKQYDKVYASKVFTFSNLPYDLPKGVEIGGSGYDVKKNLIPKLMLVTLIILSIQSVIIRFSYLRGDVIGNVISVLFQRKKARLRLLNQ